MILDSTWIQDGDLSAWPHNMERYPLEKIRVGVPATI
jgi:hypothetical protein